MNILIPTIKNVNKKASVLPEAFLEFLQKAFCKTYEFTTSFLL